jgi:hypothetical protein
MKKNEIIGEENIDLGLKDIGQKWLVKNRGYNDLRIEAEDCFNAICFLNYNNSEAKNEANAAYIVKAVNKHEALRDALLTLMLYADNCEAHPEYLQLLKASE